MIIHSEDSTLSRCEDEKIHIPGSIQPFGILLSVELPSLVISNVSLNCLSAFGIIAHSLVGTSFAQYLSPQMLQSLRHYLILDDLSDAAPLSITLSPVGDADESDWELSAHYHHGVLLVELEPSLDEHSELRNMQRSLREAVQSIFQTSNLTDLCQQTVHFVRTITGYDRVMIYRFAEDWHGHVVAEARADHVHSYLDHHFPSSDIPVQARAIFLNNWIRMIPDVRYAPSPIYPGTNPTTGAPLDLSLSALRSVSPLHTEYLQNMDVSATLTLPLIDAGKLWGLIACHHQSAYIPNSERRLGAKMLAQLASSQLALKESLEDQRYGAQLKHVHSKLLTNMEEEEDLVYGLVKHSPTMLDLAGATGGAVAIYYNNDWTIIGATPTVPQIEALVDWLSANKTQNGLYATSRLSEVFPPAGEYKAIASGLLAISIPKSERNYILWFRPEVVHTITWAGEPEKRIKMDGNIIKLHPRFSFDAWKQVVNGIAIPWKKVELETVIELRASILALDLRRAFKKEQAARALAELASQEKQNMVHTVSHDIRNPLNVIKMTLQMMQLDPHATPAMLAQLTARGIRAADSIERLVSSVLDQAKLEHVTSHSAYRSVSVKLLIHDAIDLALPLAERNGINITASFEASDLMVSCQPTRIEQVLGNLVSNALKFTPVGGRITVSARQIAGEIVVSVSDTGSGISEHLLPRIFDRFVQGGEGAELGTGLGLSIVKGIVDHDGGRIWVESTVGIGSTFYFTLPSSNQ